MTGSRAQESEGTELTTSGNGKGVGEEWEGYWGGWLGMWNPPTPGGSEEENAASGQCWKEIVGSSLQPEQSPGGVLQCDQQLAEPGPENGTHLVSHGCLSVSLACL